jgi:septal ring factor EnvC (AmiA/AmiB activator)
MYRTLSAQHGKAEQEARQLAASSKNLQDLMQKLQAQEAKIKQRAVAERSMQRAKGSLRAPAAGSVLHRYGEKKNENERYRGMVLATRAGATVVSPHDGQVAYSGAFREYGPMVLIRHAGGYMSLMAGLGSINVPVDARVRAGEPIGAMGRATKLYVELRERGKPIDPARWFAKLTR